MSVNYNFYTLCDVFFFLFTYSSLREPLDTSHKVFLLVLISLLSLTFSSFGSITFAFGIPIYSSNNIKNNKNETEHLHKYIAHAFSHYVLKYFSIY